MGGLFAREVFQNISDTKTKTKTSPCLQKANKIQNHLNIKPKAKIKVAAESKILKKVGVHISDRNWAGNSL